MLVVCVGGCWMYLEIYYKKRDEFREDLVSLRVRMRESRDNL